MSSSIEHRVIQYLTNNMSSSDRMLFEQELKSDALLLQVYKEYAQVWESTGDLQFNSADLNDSWTEFERLTQPTARMFSFSSRPMQLVASVVLIAVFSSIAWLFTQQDTRIFSAETTKSLMLEDHTKIKLNRRSSLFYSKDFNSTNRELTLFGEAEFEVAKSKVPFIVHTHQGDIYVLGTHFKAYTDESSDLMLIDLFEGKVLFVSDDQKHYLNAGDRLLVQNGKISSYHGVCTPMDKNQIICRNVPLSYIFGQLKLVYGVDYNINSLEDLSERYTLSIPKNDLQSCLSILCQVSGKKFSLIQNSIVLK